MTVCKADPMNAQESLMLYLRVLAPANPITNVLFSKIRRQSQNNLAEPQASRAAGQTDFRSNHWRPTGSLPRFRKFANT